MNYQETLDFMYAQLPMFSRIGAKAIKIDLTNTILLCEALGNPQNKIKTIHVAGTNGKGSVSHSLAAVLQTAGYKTGLYTSPHLKDFRERIRVNGEFCEQEFVVDFIEQIQPQMDKIKPSFFELTVAMAFSYFAKENCDIAIIETGLGGRLDSTNIIHPELSIITNIGWDHLDILGDNLSKIAYEKAGIIKANTPVIIGEYNDETLPVFLEKAKQENATIILAQDQWTIESSTFYDPYLEIEIQENESHQILDLQLDLPGIYQEYNIKTTLSALIALLKKAWAIKGLDILNGLKNVKKLTGLRGRWDILSKEPFVIMDVGHNKSCMEQIRRQLDTMNYNKLYIICGFVKDKDIDAALEYLPKEAELTFTQAHIPRALNYLELQEKAANIGLKGDAFDNVNDAIAAKKAIAQAEDIILICGSIFLVGEINY